MFFIFGGYVKSPKGKKKIKSHKDTDVDEWVGSEEEGLDSAVSWFVDEGTETGVSI